MKALSNNARTGNFKSKDEILHKLERADVVIYQPLGEKHGSLSERNLKRITGSDATLVSFPYLFNSGMYSLGHAPLATNNEYGFIYGEEIIKRLLQEHSLEDVLDLYRKGLIDFKLKSRFNFCMSELSRRESYTDIKVTDFIRANYQSRKLLLDVTIIRQLSSSRRCVVRLCSLWIYRRSTMQFRLTTKIKLV